MAADPRRLFLAAAALWLLSAALTLPARSYGDAGEYHLTAESFLRHGTPEMRAGDVASLAARSRRFDAGINFAAVLAAYYEDRGGRWHAIHFWGYPLTTAPARGVLRLFRLNDLRNAQLTNALLFLLALHQVVLVAGFTPRVAIALGLLVLFSPALWFIGWTHPEAFCFSLLLLALAWTRAGHRHRAVLAAALASMGNPTILWLVPLLWLRAWWPERARLLAASVAALPATLAPLFYLWRYGMPSLIARETASVANLSVARTLELFFDLNIGLFPYAPIAVLLFAFALPLSLRDRRWAGRVWGLAAVAALLAWSCTVTGTWNHGTAGPSRYSVWIAAFVFFALGESHAWIDAHGRTAARRAWLAALALAVMAQVAVVFGRGGLQQRDDGLDHSAAARLALRHAPALYNPSPEIFVSRTRQMWSDGEQPAVYRDDRGCRKAWLRPRDREWLERECGAAPPGHASFFDLRGRDRRQTWAYVSFP